MELLGYPIPIPSRSRSDPHPIPSRSNPVPQALRDVELLGFDEWTAIVADLGLVDTQFTLLESVACFAWCRMRVVDESSDASRPKLVQLSFEDFLEALVRVATAKAMPTDADLEAAQYSDAGRYLLALRDDPARHDAFLLSRNAHWTLPPLQPPWRQLEHLLSLVARLLKGTSGDLHVTQADIAAFRKKGGGAAS